MAKRDDLQERLQALRDQYARQLPTRLAELESGLAWLSEDPGNDRLLALLHRQVHSLTGSGASFGYPELSRSARSLEHFLKSLVNSGETLSDSNLAQIRALLVALQESAAASSPLIP
jgi:HPt (histidine-containing phosphotransfer) domain-containing protein